MTRHRTAYLAAAAPIVAAVAMAAAAPMVRSTGSASSEAPVVSVNANEQLRCVAPGDASAIDAVLAAAGSPLAGDGATIVTEANAAGIDPRFIVAVAAHETMLMTYGPAAKINNPFGLGPGMRFADHKDAIRFAARLLGKHYVGEGRTTIPLIGSKWAPVGATNDPANLNSNWTAGVSKYFAALGGDPHSPITADRQTATDCATQAPAPVTGPDATAPTNPPAPPAPLAAGTGAPLVVVWNGRAPAAAPGTPPAPTIEGFVFPLAVPADGQVRYTSEACPTGTSCATPVESAAMAHVVAAVPGTLQAATAEEQQQGVAFWIATDSGDRVGYGPLASYEPGVQVGSTVTPGQPLGRSTGIVAFSWEKNGAAVDPRPLLGATRPSA